MSARLEFRDVSLRYGRNADPALKGLSLSVEPGELVALLGPSGCGKTTALKIVAGLLAPTSGDVLVDGRSTLRVPPEKRGAAMVFQKPLLFPHMSVEANVGFGLKMRGMPQGEIRARAHEALRRVRMEGYGERRPGELSGGQQQRVSLARALVTQPKLLLLDEPLSALDANLRDALRDLLREVQEEGGYTTLFVTHDQEEAVVLADRIALVTEGTLRMYDRPEAFYDRPKTREVAEFFGATNFMNGYAGSSGDSVQTSLGTFRLATTTPPGRVTLTIRPEAVRLSPPSEGGGNSFTARVSGATYLGTQISYNLESGETSLRATLPPHTRLAVGEKSTVRLPAESLWPLRS